MPKAIDPSVAHQVMLKVGLSPLTPYPGRAVSPWQCECQICGQLVSPSYNAVQQGGGCRFCARERVSKGRRLDPDYAAGVMREAGLQPLIPYPGAFTPWPCECTTCGDRGTPLYNNVAKRGRGCLKCGREKGAKKRRTPEHLVRQGLVAAGAEPLVPYVGNMQKKWPSLCLRCQREIHPVPYSVLVNGKDPCRWCSRHQIHPDSAVALLREAGAEPQEPFPGARNPWKCQCIRCGLVIYPRYDTVSRGSNPCKYCVWAAQGEYLRPPPSKPRTDEWGRSRALQHDVEPLEAYPGRNSLPWHCKCMRCGNDLVTNLAYIVSNRHPCRSCGYQAVAEARRKSAPEAIAQMKRAGAEPLEPYVDGATPWRCRCLQCNQEITPRLALVSSGISAHPYCPARPVHGFNREVPAILYLITHTKWGIHKVGIAGRESLRLNHHRSQGWSVYKTRNFDTGGEAHRVEQAVITWMRDQGWLPASYRGSGWTESVNAEAVSLKVLWQKVLKFCTETS